jgi:acetylornithine deacetylase/succinyl-diaminopimelate desuccinylase-like protein
VVAALDAAMGLKTVMIGFSSPNGNFHAPNEWLPLANYRNGMDAVVRLWGVLGETTAAGLRG